MCLAQALESLLEYDADEEEEEEEENGAEEDGEEILSSAAKRERLDTHDSVL